jgi:hypothetical protein
MGRVRKKRGDIMSDVSREDRLLEIFRRLDDVSQQQVIRFAEKQTPAPTGREFLERTAHIQIPADALDQMEKDIEDAFGRVDDLPQGISGRKAIEIVASLDVPDEAIDEMERAINEARENSKGFPDVDFDN